MSADLETLAAIELFAGIGDAAIARISRQCAWLHLQPGKQVLQTDEPSSDIFFIVKGTVTVNNFSSTGREVTYATIREGGFFGEFSAVDGAPRSANVVTLTEAVIARLSPATFRTTLMEYPQVTLRLCEHLVAKNRELTSRVYEFSAFSVPHRIQLEILRLCDRGKTEGKRGIISPAPTHYEIATRTSTHREAVSRELSQLAQQGILEVGR
ncbi:MAG: Crp/Fnr family transcriptional regulator, partial [Caldilineaceae bacterium]|nr:Crp/Fnr family transcriptional regulator [Caldilineaceae bacterium]